MNKINSETKEIQNFTVENLEEILEKASFNLSGGNDDGYIQMEIEKDIKEKYKENIHEIEEKILEYLYANCNYGSFAGNFEVYLNGEYFKEYKELVFTGDETDMEDHDFVKTHVIEYSLENYTNIFDSYNLLLNVYNGDFTDVDFRLNIKNGLWKDEYHEIENQITEMINNLDINNLANIDENFSLVDKKEIEIIVEETVYRNYEKTLSFTLEEIFTQFN